MELDMPGLIRLIAEHGSPQTWGSWAWFSFLSQLLSIMSFDCHLPFRCANCINLDSLDNRA